MMKSEVANQCLGIWPLRFLATSLPESFTVPTVNGPARVSTLLCTKYPFLIFTHLVYPLVYPLSATFSGGSHETKACREPSAANGLDGCHRKCAGYPDTNRDRGRRAR